MKKINTFLGMLFCMLMISPQVYSAQEPTEENTTDDDSGYPLDPEIVAFLQQEEMDLLLPFAPEAANHCATIERLALHRRLTRNGQSENDPIDLTKVASLIDPTFNDAQMDFIAQPSTVDDLFADISEANPSANINFTDIPLSLLSAPLTINELEPEIDLFTSFTPRPSSNVTISHPTPSAHEMRTKSSCLAGIHRVGPCGCRAPTRQFQPEDDSLTACALLSDQNFLIDEDSDASLVLPKSSTALNIDTESSARNQAQEQVHNDKKSYQCDICNKIFTTSSNLTAHKRIHSGERPFTCDICDTSFIISSHLTTHKKIHSGERPFTCDICDTSFIKSSHLKQHKRTHSGERPFICDICDKSFTQTSCLTIHKRIHTDKKPYACPICDKTFSDTSNLNRHKLTHTGERPFTCDTSTTSLPITQLHPTRSSKNEFSSFSLILPAFTATNTKSSTKKLLKRKPADYKCSQCGYQSLDGPNFRRHVKIHADIKPYSCPICDKTFSDRSNLKRHNQTAHKEQYS